jgi:hypothetical protein
MFAARNGFGPASVGLNKQGRCHRGACRDSSITEGRARRVLRGLSPRSSVLGSQNPGGSDARAPPIFWVRNLRSEV